MSTVDPNNSQAAIFAKLGLSQTKDAQSTKKILLDNLIFEIDDYSIAKPRSVCSNG